MADQRAASVIETQNGPMRIVEATPDGARSAVVVLHQAGGLSPQIDEVVAWLAGEQLHAVAPDLFHRKNMPPGFNPMAEFGGDRLKFDRWLEGDGAILADVDAVLDRLRGLGFAERAIGVLGYSYGGRAACMVAVKRPVGAAVSWYGPGIPRKNFFGNPELPALADLLSSLQAPWLGIFGELDGLTPPEETDELEKLLESAPVTTDVIRYDEAGHAFDVEHGGAQRTPAEQSAAADARSRTLTWFRTHLVTR
jgi:carboxymethylenebutenolidase